MRTRPFHGYIPLCLALALVGCAGERPGKADDHDKADLHPDPGTTTDLPEPTVPEPTVPLETVEERLAALGVATPTLDEAGPVLADRTGRLLAAGSHPLRDPTATLQGAAEIVVVGPGGSGTVIEFDPPTTDGYAPHVMAWLGGAFELWNEPEVVALHADDDGREETVVVDLQPSDDPALPADVFLWVAEDAEAGFVNPFGLLGSDIGEWDGASDLDVTRFDVEGDGVEEVLLIARVGDGWELRTLAPLAATLGPVLAGGELVPAALSNEEVIGFSVATGQLDGDPAMEVSVVIDTRPDLYGPGHSRLVVLDEQAGALSPVFDEVVAMSDGRPLIGAGVAFADIDADFVDELVVGGVEYASEVAAYHQLVVVLEDLVDPATALLPVFEGGFTASLPDGDATIRFLDTQVHAGSASPTSLDGSYGFDGAEDVLVNNVLWEFTTAGLADPADPVIALPPRQVFAFDGGNQQIDISSDIVQFALGHFDLDGNPDAAVYSVRDLFVGLDGSALPAGGLFVRSVVPGVDTDAQFDLNPEAGFPARMVPANVDSDSVIVQYLPDRHTLAYSEPVILAAIAAPPCYAGPLGQNTGNCAATLGASSSTSTTAADSMSVTAGLHVGFKFDGGVFTQSEVTGKVTLEATAATGFGASSSLSFSRAYANGSDKDQVLATVMGFEQFEYLVLSAPLREDGTSLAGETIVVSVPRTDSITTGLFSDDLIRPSMRQSQRDILDRIFTHVPTEPFTYLRSDEVPGLLSSLGVTGSGCDENTPASALDDCGWLTHEERVQTPVVSGPLSGVGSSEAAVLAVGTSWDQWTRWGVSNTIDLEVTAGGVLFGASVGTAYENTVSVTHGDTVEYGLEIGAVDPEVYEPYSASLYGYNVQFDCVVDDLGEEECDGFQVLGFTVE